MMTTRISLLGLADKVAAKRMLEKNEQDDDDGRKKLVLGLYDDDDGNDDALTDLGNVDFEVIEGGGITVKLPPLTPDIIPCQHAWVLQLSHVMDATAATTATTTVEATITMPKP
jgi:hypothetical protein